MCRNKQEERPMRKLPSLLRLTGRVRQRSDPAPVLPSATTATGGDSNAGSAANGGYSLHAILATPPFPPSMEGRDGAKREGRAVPHRSPPLLRMQPLIRRRRRDPRVLIPLPLRPATKLQQRRRALLPLFLPARRGRGRSDLRSCSCLARSTVEKKGRPLPPLIRILFYV